MRKVRRARRFSLRNHTSGALCGGIDLHRASLRDSHRGFPDAIKLLHQPAGARAGHRLATTEGARDEQGPAICQDLPQLIALDEVLELLARLNPRQAQVVELHFFAGLTEAEAAEVLDVSVKTVKNDWRFAKAWLKTEMGIDSDGPGTPRANSANL